jgi:hypothetical protein
VSCGVALLITIIGDEQFEINSRKAFDGKDIEEQLGRILRLILPTADYPRDDSILTHYFHKGATKRNLQTP